jgi:hypothetical protein
MIHISLLHYSLFIVYLLACLLQAINVARHSNNYYYYYGFLLNLSRKRTIFYCKASTDTKTTQKQYKHTKTKH